MSNVCLNVWNKLWELFGCLQQTDEAERATILVFKCLLFPFLLFFFKLFVNVVLCVKRNCFAV